MTQQPLPQQPKMPPEDPAGTSPKLHAVPSVFGMLYTPHPEGTLERDGDLEAQRFERAADYVAARRAATAAKG